MFKKGDLIIYRKPKRSEHPGPRAKNIRPASSGEDYHYEVDKYWRVMDVENNELVIKTRGGKVHHLPVSDPHIHKASILTTWLMRNKFPSD